MSNSGLGKLSPAASERGFAFVSNEAASLLAIVTWQNITYRLLYLGKNFMRSLRERGAKTGNADHGAARQGR
jgi:hypothetical protein